MELVITFLIIILMLIVVCFIGSLILVTETKEFHINFSWKGFDISGSFFEKHQSK